MQHLASSIRLGSLFTRDAIVRRSLATAAAAAPAVKKNIVSADGYQVAAGVLVARTPVILRDPTSFETAYFKHQESSERDQAAPFPVEFYFKKGSIAEKRWLAEHSGKGAATKDPNGKGALEETGVNAQFTPAPRETTADLRKDVHSLDRALQRTLYLIVKKAGQERAWQFPEGLVEKNELLHEAAEREVFEQCGSNMDLWFVGRAPVGHFVYNAPKSDNGVQGTKVFFMKARIFSGQAAPEAKTFQDFAWVTKQELKDYVHEDYYNAVKDMLSEL
ncbi:hypothetical protein K493DRAFT_314588 [Basidiobolus meristosporus CBS 931.73]|uniref:Large ribosomal subunit protein mL46 n=1 Tax=Basidiobolus meristosporus CBS 931.73 TaxID=1314790 RepID=A0A1Y1YF82_9FUNG|nr:hypothetical protein K493DRAFT_314588 [Basidiobolus meristosporus CBS 931.73]|eukprot:ORX96254.1 hypothetical protein K493DRAFT_314588 [Basidiobolus meristosporus CBS 931.73]